ncbi:hypothetical protein D3Y59_16770 [Hymenobacter oligotrophus]|uniref:Uncharacterized protein n=2 Tax=Hymenobacter oligotrophus TaxID=2319843 RepID=A0A3B7R554_9BACT|nr:hypothetical protein D3Y59_16770 [Hymenobacter oligotrophus]
MRLQWRANRQRRFKQAGITEPAVSVVETDSFLLWKQELGISKANTRLSGRNNGDYLVSISVPLFSVNLNRAVVTSAIQFRGGETVVYQRVKSVWKRQAIISSWEE